MADNPSDQPAGDEAAYDEVIDRALNRLRPAARRAARERGQLESALKRMASSPEGYAALSEGEKRALKPWARLNLLWEASFRERFRNPKKMAELAYYASITARNLPTEVYGEALTADLQARAWAELANADRVNEHLEQANAGFAEARRLLRNGTGNPLVRARVADLEASLRRVERRMPEALALLSKAGCLYTQAGDFHLAGKAIVSKALVLLYEGSSGQAVNQFREGLSLLDRQRDPEFLAAAQLSLIRALAESADFVEAGRLLIASGLREAFAEEPLNLLKLRWLEATILAGRGQQGRAEEVLAQVRAGFKKMEQEYDAALVGLELAALWLQRGKLDAVQALATETLLTFRRLKIDVHALAAVQFLAECCRRKILSAKILTHVRDFLGRFQQNPHLRFEYSG